MEVYTLVVIKPGADGQHITTKYTFDALHLAQKQYNMEAPGSVNRNTNIAVVLCYLNCVINCKWQAP